VYLPALGLLILGDRELELDAIDPVHAIDEEDEYGDEADL
jgi:hypothetical protein